MKKERKNHNTITQNVQLVIELCSECKHAHLSSSNGACTIFCDACMRFTHEGLKDVGASDAIPDYCPLLEENDRREGWSEEHTSEEKPAHVEKTIDNTDSTVYIHSLGKRISIDEFNQYTYQKGHVYKLSNGLMHYCYGHDDDGRPLVDSVSVAYADNTKNSEIIYRPAVPLPSLDFVNKVFLGEIVELTQGDYLSVCIKITKLAKELKTMLE